MSLPPPVHIYQLDGSAWAGFACMGAVGAMALDAYTSGGIRVSMHDIHRNQSDQSGGIGLNDVAEAWRRGWGLTFWQGTPPWSTVAARLASGDGAAIAVTYALLGKYRASSFAGGHALWLQRFSTAPDGTRVIILDDPLRRTATAIPESVVRAAWTGGAGWGQGTYQGAKSGDQLAAWGTLVSFPVGHVLVPADVDLMMSKLDGAGMFAKDPTGLARSTTRAVLTKHLGERWSTTLQATMAGELGAAAKVAGAPLAGTPLDGIASALANLPNTLAHTGVLLGIVVLALLGVVLTFREPLAVIPSPARRLVA